LNKDFRCPAS